MTKTIPCSSRKTYRNFLITPFLIGLLTLLASCHDQANEKVLGTITTATPEASQAGEEILLKGGNAVDAAIAISFALGVTEPAMSGLGGGTQVLLSLKNAPPIAINGTTLSPAATPIDLKDTLSYHRRSTIPSTVRVLDYLWRKYGSKKLSWEQLLAPAIKLAENGFALGPYRAKVYQQYEEKLLAARALNTIYWLKEDGTIPQEGDTLKQPILAKTLRRLAQYGADDFYRGEIAQKIADDMQANAGWISLSDLNNFPEPQELAPLSVTHHNMIVYSQPPPCGGWTSLLALQLMEEISPYKQPSQENIAQALYLAHRDRRNRPIVDLINYDSMARIKLSGDYSKQLLLEALPNSTHYETKANSGETTHFSVVDAQGNAVAVTASINAYFGSLSASPKLGFLYNTYMDDFIFEEPDHPFAIRPGAMAYSSMSPTIVQQEGENVLVIGSPGSSRIISTVAQMTAQWIAAGGIVQLSSKPRIHITQKNIYLENKADTSRFNRQFLTDYDLRFGVPSEKLVIREGINAYYGGVHAIAKENGQWIGVADPRRDGKVIEVRE